MTFTERLTHFGGLPVVDYILGDQPEKDSPGDYAWRIALPFEKRHRPSGGLFAFLCGEFTGQVDPAEVRALVIGNWGDPSDTNSSDPIRSVTGEFPNLRALFIGDIVQEEWELSWIDQGAFTLALNAFPLLEELVVRGGGGYQPQPTRHEHLRVLRFESAGLEPPVIHGVVNSDFPALETLELWLGEGPYDLAPLLEGSRVPKLRHLGLRNSPQTDLLVKQLATSPLAQQISVLDLSLGTLGDEGATRLLDLTHLQGLDARHHFMSEMMAARLAERGADVREPQGGRRYVAVSE